MPVASAESSGVTPDGFEYIIKDGSVTITGYAGDATEVVIPAEINGCTVDEIGKTAFRYEFDITKVTIPDTVKVLADEAFYCCYGLKEVKLPKGLQTVGEDVFKYAPIEKAEIPNDTLCIPELGVDNVEYNGEYLRIRTGLFGHCDSLKEVTFAEGVTSIPDNLLAGCLGLESVTIPDSVETIGQNSFAYCLNLKEVNFPESVKCIGQESFFNCVNLKEVKLPEGLQKLGGAAFSNSGLETVNIPASLDEVVKTTYGMGIGGHYATYPGPFWKCESLKNVHIDEEVTEILPNLFAGATGLESIVFPDSLEKIGEFAFLGCASLDEVVFSENLKEIEMCAFTDAVSLTEIELPESIEKLGQCAFSYTNVEEIRVPASLKEAEGDPYFNYTDTEYGKISVAKGPFYGCKNLRKVSFDNSVDTIPDYLFTGAYSLEKIEFNGNIKTIGSHSFSGCFKLTELDFPESVELIDEAAFSGCIGLEKISFKNPDAEILSSAFKDCVVLNDVTLPENLVKVSYDCFRNCISLEKIELPEGVAEIGSTAFAYCSSLDEITLPEKLSEIESGMFLFCTSLESITIPENVTIIWSTAFHQCTSLKEVNFMDYSVVHIWEHAFDGCSSLDEITLPKGIRYIENDAFNNCPSLEKAVVPYSVREMGERAFTGDKVTIYSREGSYVHQYAKDNNLKFVNDYVPATRVEYVGENPMYVENGNYYKAEFKVFPENSTEIINLTCDHGDTYIQGLRFVPINLKSTAVMTAILENGSTASFEISARRLEKIEVESLPFKSEYIPSEELDTAGLKVNGVYNNGDVEEIDDYTLEGFSSEESGKVTVTVTYKDQKAEFTVRIKTGALLGDVNFDGKINIKDATAIQKHIAKLATLDDNGLKVADVNGDGKVNVKDATEIQKFVANILDETQTQVGKGVYI